MVPAWTFSVLLLFPAFTEGQPMMGGYLGLYNSNNYYMPQMYMRPAPHSRLLPFTEELVLDSVVEESSYFKIKSKTIKQWLRLQADHQYLLGIGDREVTLISMYKIKEDSYQAHEYPIAMPYKINCVTMFKPQSAPHGLHPQHGFVLIGFDSPEPMVVLYKIKNFKLANVTSWKRERRVQSVAHFKWLHEDRIVIVEEAGDISFVNVQGLKFEHHLPHFWHIETLPLNRIEGHPSIVRFHDGRVYMAVIQSKDSVVKVFTYKSVCFGDGVSLSGNKFESLPFSPQVVAKKVMFFEVYDRKYMMTISLHTMLFAISLENHLMEDTKFTLSADMLVLPLSTSSGGAILLGKSFDGTPHVYTLSNPNGQWRESPTPRCRRSGFYVENGSATEVNLKECIGGSRSWSGATYIDAEGYPSLLFADRTYPGELYHFSYSIRTSPLRPSAFDNTLDEIEAVWNSLRSNLLSQVLGRSAASTESSPICSVQPEITLMHKMLSDVKDRLALTQCAVYPAELALQEAEHNIVVDEGKPEEVISIPSEGDVQGPETEGSSGTSSKYENHIVNGESASRLDWRKNTIISPELEEMNNNWKGSDITDPGMGEVDGIYTTGPV